MVADDKVHDLSMLFKAGDQVDRWKAEHENTAARLELARRDEHAARLISQHEPVATLGLDREKLRAVLRYLVHGDLRRLNQEAGPPF